MRDVDVLLGRFYSAAGGNADEQTLTNIAAQRYQASRAERVSELSYTSLNYVVDARNQKLSGAGLRAEPKCQSPTDWDDDL